MKHMILSFKIKGDVISDHFLMLWFQKDSLDTVGFRTFRTFRGGSWILADQTDILIPKCTEGRGGSASLGNIPKKYHFLRLPLLLPNNPRQSRPWRSL